MASERTEVAVDPASLREYEGSYELGPGFILKFWVEGDQLMTQATNQSAFPMFAKGPDQFFLKVVDAKLVFDRDTAGEVTSVTLHQNGAVMEGSKQ